MMKRLSIFLAAMFVMALGVFAQERREQPTPEQIQAYLRTLTSHPDQHILSPDPEAAKVSPYRGMKNYGKRIAVFGGSLRFFGSDAGHNPFSEEPNKTGKTFSEYIDAQKACCAHYGIPVLDQFNLQGINAFNCRLYYQKDLLHMNEDGYTKIGPVQAAFLSNGR